VARIRERVLAEARTSRDAAAVAELEHFVDTMPTSTS